MGRAAAEPAHLTGLSPPGAGSVLCCTESARLAFLACTRLAQSLSTGNAVAVLIRKALIHLAVLQLSRCTPTPAHVPARGASDPPSRVPGCQEKLRLSCRSLGP
jgi:hypothetical protein